MIKKWITALLLVLSAVTFLQLEVAAMTKQETVKQSRYLPGYSADSRITLTPENTPLTADRSILSVPVIENSTELHDFLLEKLHGYETVFHAYYYGDLDTLIDDMEATIQTNDYIYGILTEFAFSAEDSYVTFEISYATSSEQQEFIDKEVRRIVSDIIEPDMTDVERVLAINNYIVRNTTYSFDSEASPHSAYAIVTEGLGVCQAYAMLAYQMYWAVGLEAHYVAGYAGEEHAWNLVKVDGQWYHIDSTWNDPELEIEFAGDLSDYIDYSYFLVSEKTLLAEDRTIEQRSALPRATSERFALVRQAASTDFSYDDTIFLLTPEFANGILYFVDFVNESYAIQAIDLNSSRLKIEQVLDTEAMELFATEDSLYFTNVENDFGLSKYVFTEDAVYDLYTGERVTEIRTINGFITAFNNGKTVYTEESNNGGGTGTIIGDVNQLLGYIEEILNTIDYESSSFREQASMLLYYVDEIPYHLEDVLSAETISAIEDIREIYNNMQNVSFDDYQAWDELVTDDPEKVWTITLSKEIANTAANLQKIKLLDLHGHDLEAIISIDGKKMTIEYEYLYTPNVPYSIIIEQGFESESGSKLRKGVYIPFYVAQ